MPGTAGVMYARPAMVVFALALLEGVLPSAPGVSQLGLIAGNLLAVAAAFWLLLSALSAHRHSIPALVLAAAMFAVGSVHLNSATSKTWGGGIVAPLLLFVGLQIIDQTELRQARSITRWVLFLVVTLDVLLFVGAAGPGGLVSPSFVFGHHDDLVLWGKVGDRVLGNPNNASVIFCTAFAWALGERVVQSAGRLSWVFVVVSGLAVWSTGSRGAIATAIVTAIAAGALSASTRKRIFRVLLLGGAALLAVNYFLTRIAPSATHASNDETARLAARQVALPVVLNNPFGTGPGTTIATLRFPLASVFGNNVGASSHDLFLNWGVATGWIGMALLLVATVGAIVNGRRGGGWIAVLPLLAFLLDAESAGIDALNPSNPAWSVMLWVLLGISWRGGLLLKPEAADQAYVPASTPTAPLSSSAPTRASSAVSR